MSFQRIDFRAPTADSAQLSRPCDILMLQFMTPTDRCDIELSVISIFRTVLAAGAASSEASFCPENRRDEILVDKLDTIANLCFQTFRSQHSLPLRFYVD